MIDPITTLLEDLQIARTSEPLLLIQPPQQTPAAVLYGRAMEGIRQLKFRIQDLLEANNRYLLRSHEGEILMKKMLDNCILDGDLEDEVRDFLKQPWSITAEVKQDEDKS